MSPADAYLATGHHLWTMVSEQDEPADVWALVVSLSEDELRAVVAERAFDHMGGGPEHDAFVRAADPEELVRQEGSVISFWRATDKEAADD